MHVRFLAKVLCEVHIHTLHAHEDKASLDVAMHMFVYPIFLRCMTLVE